jgi:hypothetical protein
MDLQDNRIGLLSKIFSSRSFRTSSPIQSICYYFLRPRIALLISYVVLYTDLLFPDNFLANNALPASYILLS